MTRPRDPTQFTRESAERIGRVVRAAELATPIARPINFEQVDTFKNAKLFRVATYTGAWSINATKVVTFKYQTSTPNTATVLNLFFPVTNTAAGSRDCAIAKEGTSWFLVDLRLATATAVFVTSTQTASRVTDVNLSASLNTSACTIAIGKTLVTASTILVTGTATATYIRIE